MKKLSAYLLLLSLIIICISACSSGDDTPAPTLIPPSVLGVQLRVDAGDEQVTVYWPRVSGADTYNIYYRASNIPTKTSYDGKITGRTSAPYPVTGLFNGTTYSFAFTAVSTANGESALSEIRWATPQGNPNLIPPEFPKNVRANNAGSQTVRVTWTPVSHVDGAADVDHYNLYCLWLSESLEIAIGGITIPGGQATSAHDVGLMNWITGTGAGTTTGLTNGTLYGFSLTAESAETDHSAEISATPGTASTDTDSGGTAAATVTATVTTGTTGQVTISWVPLGTATANTSYNIYYYKTSEGSTAGDKKIPGATATNPCTVSGLVDGTSYTFYLTSDTSSRVSFVAFATPSDNPPPLAPVITTVTAGDGYVDLYWTAPTSHTGSVTYNIYYGIVMGITKNTGTSPSSARGITLTEGRMAGLTNGVKYYFVITAVDDNGESTESAEWWAIPSATTPYSGLSAHITGSLIIYAH